MFTGPNENSVSVHGTSNETSHPYLKMTSSAELEHVSSYRLSDALTTAPDILRQF